jgi:hypothetical protein
MRAPPYFVTPLLVVALSACPNNDAPLLEQLDFEGCGDLCGLTVEGTGRAEVVATIHPGEHGLRLTGEVTVHRAVPSPVTISSIDWVQEGAIQLSVEVDADAGDAPPPFVHERSERGREIEEVPGGFRPMTATFEASPIGIRGFAFHHNAGDAPATVDVIQVLGDLAFNPGCY